MKSIAGKIAIVTGANRGIGHAIGVALAAEGVRLGLLGRTNPPEDVPGEFVRCDLADVDRIAEAVQALCRKIGPVDFLINNAGVFLEKPAHEITLDEWEHVLRVNLTAPFLLCRAVLPQMITRKQGRIVNIVSTSGVQGYLHQSAYCASKHGLLGFARSLAIEAKPHGVHVYNICPGGVDTEFIKGTYLGQRLAGRPMINPADIAALVVFVLKQPDNVDLPELLVRRFDPG